ncbi:MAG TPA: deoxynucleoside kinase [Anaerolineaceae bacterium]|nr:deoxynucleoside kinase [Anaerolineaceae bacterium]
MVKRLILVAGNIGSGKTSLTERIGERLGWHTAYESVVDNPYLPDFYANMREWAFHLQVYFLGHRAQQHLDMYHDPRSAIIDRSIYEDAFIFARALYSMGNINERDYGTYRKVFDLITATLPHPSLLIYLKCPVDTLIKRIQSRGRDIESSISRDYLVLLESYYDDWTSNFDLCPILTIRTDDLDFVHEPRHLNTVVKKIKEKLAGREEIVF